MPGVRAADCATLVPVPAALTAATRNVYLVPLVRPVTVAEVAGETPSATVVQVAPASLLIRTT